MDHRTTPAPIMWDAAFPHSESTDDDLMTQTLDPIEGRAHANPTSKLSIWRAAHKERCSNVI